MRDQLRNALKNESGQGMTEYIIIVALIAIAAIGVVTIFGDNIRDIFAASSSALSGQTSVKRQISKANVKFKSKNLNSFAKKNVGTAKGQ